MFAKDSSNMGDIALYPKLYAAYESIMKKLNLNSEVFVEAFSIYLKAKNKRALRGYSMKEIAAGTIFVACTKLGKNISIKEISRASEVDGTLIWSLAKNLQKRGLISKVVALRDLPSLMVTKLQDKIDNEDLKVLQNVILKKFSYIKEVAGHLSPRALLGGIVWLASKRRMIKRKLTQREISNIFGVNEVSIREAVKRIQPVFSV
jgi:transcription initiation factor TFIIB